MEPNFPRSHICDPRSQLRSLCSSWLNKLSLADCVIPWPSTKRATNLCPSSSSSCPLLSGCLVWLCPFSSWISLMNGPSTSIWCNSYPIRDLEKHPSGVTCMLGRVILWHLTHPTWVWVSSSPGSGTSTRSIKKQAASTWEQKSGDDRLSGLPFPWLRIGVIRNVGRCQREM